MPGLSLWTMTLLTGPAAPGWAEADAVVQTGRVTDIEASLAMPIPMFGAINEESDRSLLSHNMKADEGPAPRQSFAASDVSSFEEVSDDVLAQQRGGFSINGLEVSLGAQIETFINGQLSLVTTVNWTDTSAVTTQTVSGLLTPANAAELQAGLLSTGHITMNVGEASVFLANGGRTAVVHGLDQGIQNLLVNTANNTSIKTQVTATIDLGGYAAFKSDLQLGALSAGLGQALGAATSGAL